MIDLAYKIGMLHNASYRSLMTIINGELNVVTVETVKENCYHCKDNLGVIEISLPFQPFTNPIYYVMCVRCAEKLWQKLSNELFS